MSIDISPGPINKLGAGLVPLGVDGVLGREPSFDLVGVPGTGASEECTRVLVVRTRDSEERAALYFLAVLRIDGVERSLLEDTERGRLGVNGAGRASLEVEAMVIVARFLPCSLWE
jgi:hypothetical protein